VEAHPRGLGDPMDPVLGRVVGLPVDRRRPNDSDCMSLPSPRVTELAHRPLPEAALCTGRSKAWHPRRQRAPARGVAVLDHVIVGGVNRSSRPLRHDQGRRPGERLMPDGDPDARREELAPRPRWRGRPRATGQ
jgi:hypothetical protein